MNDLLPVQTQTNVYCRYHRAFRCRLVQEHATETRPGQGSLPLKGAVEMCLCDEPCLVIHDTTSKTGLHIGMFRVPIVTHSIFYCIFTNVKCVHICRQANMYVFLFATKCIILLR